MQAVLLGLGSMPQLQRLAGETLPVPIAVPDLLAYIPLSILAISLPVAVKQNHETIYLSAAMVFPAMAIQCLISSSFGGDTGLPTNRRFTDFTFAYASS